MGTEIKLSIIIPMYNAEKFVKDIIDYFLRFSIYPYELIFVDDCSKDKTVAMLKKFKTESDLNIKILENANNCGPGISRNNGIQVAKGKYITFLDSDDSFTDDYFENIMPLLDKDYDIVVHDAKLTYDTKKEKTYSMFTTNFDEGFIEKKKALVFVNGCTWGKLYRRSLVESNGIVFLDLKRNEDAPFTKIAFAKAESVWYLKKQLYCYYQNVNSLMHNASLLTPENAQKSFLYIESFIKEDYPNESEALFLIEYLYSTVLTNSLKMKRKDLIDYINQCETMYPNCYNNPYIAIFARKNWLILSLIKHRKYLLIRLLAVLRNRK